MRMWTKTASWSLALVLALAVVVPAQAQTPPPDQTARVQQALTNLQDFLAKYTDTINNSANDAAKELWAKAQEEAAAAQTSLSDGNLEDAMRHITRARALAENALRELRGVGGGGNLQMMRERMLRQVIELREQEDRCSQLLNGIDCPKGQQLFEQAKQAADQARDLLRNEQYAAAQEQARRAMQLFTQCLREILLCGDNVTDRINQQITAVDELIAEVDALLAENPNPEAESVQAAAKEALAKAKELMAAEEPDLRAVLAQLARARELAMHAKRLVSGAPTPGDHIKQLCENQLARLHNLLTTAHGIVDDSTSQEAKDKLAQADALATEADAALQAGEYRKCLAKITEAMRLANQAIFMARQNAGLVPPRVTDFLKDSAQHALDAWAETESRVAPVVAGSTDEHVQQLWTDAQALADEAQAAFDDGKYLETVQKISAAIQLATRAAMIATQSGRPMPPMTGNR